MAAYQTDDQQHNDVFNERLMEYRLRTERVVVLPWSRPSELAPPTGTTPDADACGPAEPPVGGLLTDERHGTDAAGGAA